MMNNTQGAYEFSIIKYPTGRFGFVGSVPVQLCDERTGSSIVLETEQQAWDAARAIGVEPAFAR